jgi:hypothetical protein
MVIEHWAVLLSQRCYGTLLMLYPVEFRVRFRKEMSQVFIDCCRAEMKGGTFHGLCLLWGRALVDLAVSVSRERGRAVLCSRSLHSTTAGFIDSIVILAIILFHLFAAGVGIASYIPHTYETGEGFLLVSAMAAALLGGFAVVCSLMLARFRRIDYRFIGL